MIKGLNHITLSVKNIEDTFIFYKDILKFKPIMKSKISCYFIIENTWIAFSLEDIQDERKLYSHIAFECEKSYLDEFRLIMKENNIIEWQKNITEGDSIYFLDPSGNKLELHCTKLTDRVSSGKKSWGNDVQWFV